MRLSFLMINLLILASCQTGNNATNETTTLGREFPPELLKVFEAHGGYETWDKMNMLSFDLEEGEHQIISLKDRKILIKGENRAIGFDGDVVWVTPDTTSTERIRFYHSLYFYFFAMPFVLGDPGTVYASVDERDLLGKSYEGIKVSFKDDIGDSPKDSYILYYDPDDYTMEWLMYTVTYRSKEESDQYNLIRYGDWATASGLVLPEKIQWYTFANDTVGEVRGEQKFANVNLSPDAPAEALFEKPENAAVAPL